MRARQRERLKQRHTLSLLSFISKQMSTRLFSLLQYKDLLTETHTGMHNTSSWANQCILVSVISQGTLLCPLGWARWQSQQQRIQSLSFCPPFLPLFAFFLFFLSFFAFSLFAFLYAICTFILYAVFCHTDFHLLQEALTYLLLCCEV